MMRNYALMDGDEFFNPQMGFPSFEEAHECKAERAKRTEQKRLERERIEQERANRLKAIKNALQYSDELALKSASASVPATTDRDLPGQPHADNEALPKVATRAQGLPIPVQYAHTGSVVCVRRAGHRDC
jgi:hypothetical protein